MGLTVLNIAPSGAAADGLISFMRAALPEGTYWRKDQVQDPRVHPWPELPAGNVRVIAEVPVRGGSTVHPVERFVERFYRTVSG